MYLPLMYNLTHKEVIIIGGGSVALRKAIKILEYGAKLKIVSLDFKAEFNLLENTICILAPYDKSYINGADLVIAATSNKELNANIYKACKDEKILCHLVDNPTISDVIFPASLKKGNINFTVSTGGNSPVLAKELLKKIENVYDEEIESKLEILGKVRRHIIENEKNKMIKEQRLEEIIKWPKKELEDYTNKTKGNLE